MEFWKWANKRAKNLNAMDIKLAEFAAICLGLVLAKAFPQLLGIRARWYVIACLILIARPAYRGWIKK